MPQQSESIERHLPKIRIFQLMQKYLATIGIDLELASQPYPLNRKIFVGFMTLCFMIVTIFKYTFYEARTLSEYTQSSYMFSFAVVVMLYLLITILRMKKLAELFDDCGNIVNTRKRKIRIPLTNMSKNFNTYSF